MYVMPKELKKQISEMEDWDTFSEEKREGFKHGFYHGFVRCLFYLSDPNNPLTPDKEEALTNEALGYLNYYHHTKNRPIK
jgi:hypothetical protein